MKTEDSIFLQALNKKPLSTPPIWYMRQAGRYMPEYRAVRKNFKNFLDMCKNSDVCCELAMQPIDAFDLDVAILFSDILTIPDAMGLGVQFLEGEGPVFENPIKTSKDVMDIHTFDPDKLSYVYKAVSNIKSALPKNIPLIGFSGSPWTLAAYSIEGRSSKSFEFTKNFIKHNEKEAHIFLQKLTDACFIYLKKQVEAGADVIQIFDSWGGLLSPDDYSEFSWQYINQIIEELKDFAPVVVFGKGCWFALNEMSKSNASALGVDWTITARNARYLSGGNITLQGNLDPSRLLYSKSKIKDMVNNMIKDFGKDKYMVNLGHGILPNIPLENV